MLEVNPGRLGEFKNRKYLPSIDLFDTLVTRSTATPKGVFHLTASISREKLIMDQTLASEWPSLREKAEAEARLSSSADEIEIDEIYSIISLKLPESVEVGKIRAVEEDVERAVSRPIAFTRDWVRGHAPGRIKIITDTYLPRAVIEDIVRINVGAGYESSIIISNEVGKTKKKGSLFLHGSLDPHAKHFHLGDNFRSDVLNSRLRGWRSFLYRGSALTRYEKYILDTPRATSLTKNLLGGALRTARLSKGLGGVSGAIWDISTNVSGPLLFSFTLWCLLEAQKAGIKDLYFLSRDGQILFEISKIICLGLKIEIHCHYLYASRQAWHLPSAIVLDEHFKSWFLADAQASTPEAILRRVGLEPAELEAELSDVGITPAVWKTPLGENSAGFAEIILNAKFQKLVGERSALRRSDALRYLDQERVSSGERIAMVDVGWHARLQASLQKLIKIGNPNGAPPVGLYFGLHSAPDMLARSDVHTFTDRTLDSDLLSGSIIELFCAANHGTVTGYVLQENEIKPTLKSEDNSEAILWGYETQRSGILSVSESLVAAILSSDCTLDESAELLRKCTLQNFRQFLTSPERLEADAIGSFRHSVDQQHETFLELAPKITVAHVASGLLNGKIPRMQSLWTAGSLYRSFPTPIAHMILSLALAIRRG